MLIQNNTPLMYIYKNYDKISTVRKYKEDLKKPVYDIKIKYAIAKAMLHLR